MLQHCSPISTTSDQESTRPYYWQQALNELRNGPNTRCVSSELPPGPFTTPDLGLLLTLKLLVRRMMVLIVNAVFLLMICRFSNSWTSELALLLLSFVFLMNF